MRPKFVVTAVEFIGRELLPFAFSDVPSAIDEVQRNSLPRDNQVLGHLNTRRLLVMCFVILNTP
jgi:hypothetical protein